MNQDEKQGKLARLLAINAELEVRKLLYEEYDRLIMELVEDGFTHETFRELEIEIVDNFLDKDGHVKNTGWTAAAVKRYCLKVTDPAAPRRKKRGE